MNKLYFVLTSCFFLFLTVHLFAGDPSDAKKNWPQWRGPDATGVAPNGNPPLEWSEDKNIRWKIQLPGKGLASPVIWDNMVFILTAVEDKKEGLKEEQEQNPGERRRGFFRRKRAKPTSIVKFTTFALNRKDGSIIWQHTPREQIPHAGFHPDASWASNSAVTDGELVFAHFGSYGLFCYDIKGNLKWEKDLGDMTTRNGFGEGSSPVVYNDKLVINWDHEGDSFIVVLDKNTGNEIWRAARDEVTSWATPIVVEQNGKPQVIASASKRIRSYDLDTGDVIWETAGMTTNTIPSPVHRNGVVYAMSGFRGNALLAIRLSEAKGDITDSEAIIWKFDRDTPYVPSPLLYGDTLYFLKHNKGILSAFNIKTGKPFYGPQRLENIQGVYASPVGAKDRVYIPGRNGVTLVIKHGPEFEVLAENVLDDGFDASPAIAGNELYLRGRKNLYCIAEK